MSFFCSRWVGGVLVGVLLCAGPVWSQSASSQDGLGQDKAVQDKAVQEKAGVAQPGNSGTPADAASTELTKAEAAMAKSDWKTAEPILNAWLAAHPADGQALFDSGYIADAQGRNDDAIAQYQKAVSADPKLLGAQVSLGLLLARVGRQDEARQALRAATTLPADGDSSVSGVEAKARAWRALAQIDAAGIDGKADPQQASIDLLEALKISPETVSDTLLSANLAEANHDEAGAEAAYRRVLQITPDSGPAVAGLAHSLIAEKKYPEAQELLEGGLKKTPEDAAMTAQLAVVLVAQDKAEALPLLEKFHTQHPKDATMTRMLAEVNADAGEYATSDQLYVGLLADDPNNAELLTGHGQNLIRLHRDAEALKAFQAATEIDETDGDAWNGLAFAAFQTHQPGITIHALTVRSKYLPENATIYFLWATAYDTLHDKKQAVAYYHHFLDSAAGKLPDQEWQARQRLAILEKTP
jgi:tetratricopeptide (TPR) repeat protein